MTISPDEMLKRLDRLIKNLEDAKRLEVAVGLPLEKVGGEVYKTEDGSNGPTILEVGIAHEYGIGVPRRSFLDIPLKVKEKDIDKVLTQQFTLVAEDKKDIRSALGLVGIAALNAITMAFATGGFSQWKPISDYTKEKKGSSAILIDTKTLANSVTWIVRNAT